MHQVMNITEEQRQRLTTEQKEALAYVKSQQSKSREVLLRQAMGHSGIARFRVVVPPLVMIGLIVPVFVIGQKHLLAFVGLAILCSTTTLWVLINYETAVINRRLDALVELLKRDERKDDDAA